VKQLPEQQAGGSAANDGDLGAMNLHTLFSPLCCQDPSQPGWCRPAAKLWKWCSAVRHCVKKDDFGRGCLVSCKENCRKMHALMLRARWTAVDAWRYIERF
jgi:hypothetical protein